MTQPFGEPMPPDGPISDPGAARVAAHLLAVDLVAVRQYHDGGIAAPVVVSTADACGGDHHDCLALEFRAAGLVGVLHLTGYDARRLAALLRVLSDHPTP